MGPSHRRNYHGFVDQWLDRRSVKAEGAGSSPVKPVMKSILGNMHDQETAVEEIIFEAERTVVVCVDGQQYGVGTTTIDGEPLGMDVHIEMYPSPNTIDHKAYLN